MTDYVPTTEEVRETFGLDRQDVDLDGRVTVSYSEAVQAFNAWLANVKAEAWEEGYRSLSGLKFAVNQYLDNGGFAGFEVENALDEAEEAKNPYRKETP